MSSSGYVFVFVWRKEPCLDGLGNAWLARDVYTEAICMRKFGSFIHSVLLLAHLSNHSSDNIVCIEGCYHKCDV